MPVGDDWNRSPHKRRQARQWLLAKHKWPCPCWKCGTILTPLGPWCVGHLKDRGNHPQLMWEPSNWAPECRPCSNREGGQRRQQQRRKRRSAEYSEPEEEQQESKEMAQEMAAISSTGNAKRGRHSAHLYTNMFMENRQYDGFPETPFTNAPRAPGPADAPPRAFPPPHPQAVASLGDHAAAWIEARLTGDRRAPADGLRHWQWLVVQRLLERRADGSWCWPIGWLSVSRQSGKSLLLQELAVWRCQHPDLFGGRAQMVAHSANTVVLSRLVQSKLWPWASEAGLQVARQLGDSALVWPDGSEWRTVAPENMFGRTLDFALVDEAFDWDAGDWWQATYPTLVERAGSQALIMSAAHEAPGSLVGTLRGNGDVCRMEWGAADGADPADPEVWRAASPFWSEQRGAAMRLAVEQPAFQSQWLNRWPGGPVGSGDVLLAKGAWDELRAEPVGAPVSCAVEASPGLPPVVAVGFRLADERVCVTVVQARTVAEAASLVPAGVRPVVGKSLTHDPAWSGLEVEGRTQTTAAACGSLRQLVGEGVVAHDGGALLAGQVASTSLAPSPAGLRVTSKGRTDAVKACVWAVEAARTVPERPMIW